MRENAVSWDPCPKLALQRSEDPENWPGTAANIRYSCNGGFHSQPEIRLRMELAGGGGVHQWEALLLRAGLKHHVIPSRMFPGAWRTVSLGYVCRLSRSDFFFFLRSRFCLEVGRKSLEHKTHMRQHPEPKIKIQNPESTLRPRRRTSVQTGTAGLSALRFRLPLGLSSGSPAAVPDF